MLTATKMASVLFRKPFDVIYLCYQLRTSMLILAAEYWSLPKLKKMENFRPIPPAILVVPNDL